MTIPAIFFAVYVQLYARAMPKVGAFPFFYFYLLAYLPVVAIMCWVIVRLQKQVTR